MVCCRPWGRKELDVTELNQTEPMRGKSQKQFPLGWGTWIYLEGYEKTL